jgi:nucleoid DNA-binding protein
MTPERIDEVRLYLLNLSKELESFIATNPDSQDACSVLFELNMAKREMSMIYDDFASAVGSMIENNKEVKIEGKGLIEKKSSYERRAWQHKDLASAVASKLSRMAIDMDTGEVIKTPEEVAIQILDYVQPSYWRVKELSNIGINADNYCETGNLKTSIIVRKES